MMYRGKHPVAIAAAALKALMGAFLLLAYAGAGAADVTATAKTTDVKNVDGVPFLGPEGKEAYRKWTFSPYNRAFAINPANGNWGEFPDENDMFQMRQVGPGAETLQRMLMHFAVQDALNRCQKQPGDKCFIYAQNGEVVWDGRMPAGTGVAQAAPAPAVPAPERVVEPVPAPREQASAAEHKPQAPSAPATGRRALVFGNDSYKYVPALRNARADATAMAKMLASLGYTVRAHYDLAERDMKKAIRDFTSATAGGDEVVFYFAGHGVQIGSANYLLPVDIRAEDAASVRDEAIALQRVLDDLSETKARLALTIVDACRDNPFRGSGRAIGGRGLAPTSAATGQMIMFSAGVGQQALDKLGPADDSPNGLFTRVLLKHVQRKGVTVDRVMRDIRSEVVSLAQSVGHEQVPAIYDQVVGDFYFSQ